MKDSNKLFNGQRIPDWILWQTSKIARFRFWFLASKFDAISVSLLFLFIGSIVSILIIGIAARFVSWNLIFPSLGPTIFLQFYNPGSPMSSPKNTVMGHLLGAITGVLFYWIGIYFGLTNGSLDFQNVLLAGVALGTGGMCMAYTGLLHPPAASTILIGVFGMVDRPEEILAIVISAAILSAVAWLVHSFSGIRFPLWAPYAKDKGPRLETKLGRLNLKKGRGSESMADMAAKLAARQKLK